MAVREAFQKKRRLTIAAALTATLLAWIAIAYHFLGPTGVPKSPKGWYTIDDGATWFADDAYKVPPFDYQGKTAYGAAVYQCPDGKQFVASVRRYPPKTKKRLEDLRSKPGQSHGVAAAEAAAFVGGPEVKRPLTGDKGWVGQFSKEGRAFMAPKCADGSLARPLMPPDDD